MIKEMKTNFQENKKQLAKSNGLDIKTHSEIVSKVSLELSKRILKESNLERFEDIIKYSSLLHDIGKLTIKFQKFLNNEIKKPGLKFRHNEIGWAFLSKYLSEDFLNEVDREIILNIVYWHHGISNKINKHTDVEILNSLEEESIENMLSYLVDCVGEENVNLNIDVQPYLTPLFYYNPNNKTMFKNLYKICLLRSIVISADRNSSNLMSLSEIDNQLIDDYLNSKEIVNIQKTKFDGEERFELQKDIVNKIEKNKTNLIKGPAGFGKTLIGVMNGFKDNKKIIWVTPRNSIAESLYDSILKEFNNLYVDCSIQLILSGEIKKTNTEELKEYESKVIVTNIDNFLAPSFKNNIMDSSALLYGANVIFDEYHELVSDAPLMSLFINIMKARHQLTDATTLLLSATPIDCFQLWESLSNKTNILPNKEEHYPASHQKKYKIKIHNKKIVIPPNTSSLCIKNTVKIAQKEKREGDYALLMHSQFTDDKIKSNFEHLMRDYGKNSDISYTKPNVVGTHILQASFDISFSTLYENILSPESTLQRIGRINRWGELSDGCVINIIKEEQNENNEDVIKSETTIKNTLYSYNLSELWYNFICKYDNKELNLNEIYMIYNSFNNENSKLIKEYITSEYSMSNLFISNIYPLKIETNKKNKEILTAGSNKLRSLNNETFYIIKHETDENKWVGPFNKIIYRSFAHDFKESDNIFQARMLKTMKKLTDNNDERFDYKEIIKKSKYSRANLENFREKSKKSNTPYIVYDRIYNDELGIVIIKNK
jgi:CRISPR-associated endonuclease/helicase Cas3